MRKRRLPKLCIHKSQKKFYVRINGRFFWCGPTTGPDAERRAEAERIRHLNEHWDERLPKSVPIRDTSKPTIAELIERYWRERVTVHYRHRDGSPTTQQGCIRDATRPLLVLYGDTRAADFGPRQLEALQRAMADGSWIPQQTDAERKRKRYKPWCVNTINAHVGRIRTMFKWGAKVGAVPVETYAALTTVEAVPEGRGYARDTDDVEPAPEEAIAAVQSYLSPVLWDVVQVQLLTGARPGEVLALKPEDFDRSGSVWQVRPKHHKTRHKGKSRVLLFGPKAQRILVKYMDRPLSAYLFSPAESEDARHAKQRKGRKSPVQPSQRSRGKKKRQRAPGTRYTVRAYQHAVARACKRAKCIHWHANQLRHNSASRLAEQFGMEVARIICGHASVSMTKQYVKESLDKAVEAMRQSG